MAAPVQFYFDFISPYSYLASEQIDGIARRHGRTVDRRPILLGITMFKVMGLKAIPETPLKGPYAAHDWRRFARLLGLPSAPAAQVFLPPLPPLRAFVWLKSQDPPLADEFARRVFRAHWGEGRDMGDRAALLALAAGLGVHAEDMAAAIESDDVKALLRSQVNEAIAAGVFGSPTFVVDGEMFWGADRMDQVDRWLATGGW